VYLLLKVWLETVLSQISPFIALDGEPAFVGKTPSEAELLDVIRLSGQSGEAAL
jgi:hypothetical protein